MQTQRRMAGVYGRVAPGPGTPGRGQQTRPRKSHRRGNDALPRGLDPENDGDGESLGRIVRISQRSANGATNLGVDPQFDGTADGDRRHPGR